MNITKSSIKIRSNSKKSDVPFASVKENII